MGASAANADANVVADAVDIAIVDFVAALP
jgi:hypothetical protein